MVKPWPQHHEYFVVVSIFWLNRCEDMDSTIDIFLIPKTADQHHWRRDRLLGQELIDGLPLPKRIICRVRFNLSIKAHLIQTMPASHFVNRPGIEPRLVFVVMIRPPFLRTVTGRLLTQEVSDTYRTERALME